MNKTQKDLRLLPRYFMIIASGILFFSLILLTPFISKMIVLEKEMVKTISLTGILISLLLFALTKSKTEDELTMKIRLQAFAGSFVYGVAYTIAQPFVSLLFDEEFVFSNNNTPLLLIQMLAFYFAIFYVMLKKR